MKTMVELLAKQTRMQHNNHQLSSKVDKDETKQGKEQEQGKEYALLPT
jgi:hypothetical protein